MPANIVLVYAHPYPNRSIANRVLLRAAQALPFVQVRSLYDLYPDFSIDVDAEQTALLRADFVVWQHPMYWYTAPALMKLWFEKVLARGWAYGESGTALHGKAAQWVVTTGADGRAFTEQGLHGHGFEAFEPVVKQTARFCGMRWEEPIVLHGAHKVEARGIDEVAARYRARLEAFGRSST